MYPDFVNLRDLKDSFTSVLNASSVCLLSGSNTWLVPETKGAVPQGGYGHSSTYDSASGSVYVHGGYKALPANKYGLVDDLYRYEVNTRTW